jgi:hypothetical protein
VSGRPGALDVLHGPDGYELTIFGALVGLNVGSTGTHIVLLASAESHTGDRRWIHPPRSGFRPLMRVAPDAVLGVG